MIRCSGCGRGMGREGDPGPVASISGGILGDEVTDSYFLCRECDAYTVEVVRDRFLGGEETSLRGPLSRAEGDERVALIRACTEPWDKRCRCPAHRAYFGGGLD